MKHLCALALFAMGAAQAAPDIKLNQLGFLPGGAKLALVPAGAASSYEVINSADDQVVLRGSLGAASTWAPAAEAVQLMDFSRLHQSGTYRLRVPGQPVSTPFTIRSDAYAALSDAALKAFYFNRSGTALEERHAGVYARPLGHPDDQVLVHASAASKTRPAGTVISAPRGWYDAGDYNKYLPSSAITTWTLLAAYEHYPSWFSARDINIPESGDAVPDILDEAMWNLTWMLAMQDPDDGGVYHKLTNLQFDAMVMPHQAMREPRYVVQKSTAAALGFAATMATASRVLANYEARWPGMAARMRGAAERAWDWARAHPQVTFKNPVDVVTGEYDDTKLADEFAWAAAELYITTAKDSYYRAFAARQLDNTVPAWDDVRGLAWASLAQHRASLTPLADRALIEGRILTLADQLAAVAKDGGYRVAMRADDFVWGSNAVVLNQALMLIQAYRLQPQAAYLQAAQSGLDYVLGRNPLGRSFVTGFGTTRSLHPHHRPSQGDAVVAPLPGFVIGGAQPFQQDAAECPPYPSKLPALSYLDHVCSYASNEIAINWNAPLVYVSAALSVLTPAPTETTMTTPALTALLEQEQQLRFDSFTPAQALAVGRKIVALAAISGAPVTVDIRRDGELLFAHAMAGAPLEHLDWIARKNRVVDVTGHSSYYSATAIRQQGGNIDAVPGFDMRQFAFHGGAFPIRLADGSVRGTITVSGRPDDEDHGLVVRALQALRAADPD